jgi:hypothetical protein
MFICPVKAESNTLIMIADPSTDGGSGQTSSENSTSEKCKAVFGDPTDSNDFAYYLQTIFNIMKFAAPLMVIIFTIVDLLKAVASGKDDDLKKLGSKTLKRFGYAIIVFFLPDIINYVFGILGLYGTCGIS